MKISLRAVDQKTVRPNPTTQLEFDVDIWPGNTFCLWLPEIAYADFTDPIWEQWDPDPGVALQNFAPTPEGGLEWRFSSDRCEVTTRATPKGSRLDLETRITNKGRSVMPHASPQNCLHFPKAYAFLCLDFSRVWFRSNGRWRTILSTLLERRTHSFNRTDASPQVFPQDADKERSAQPEADHPLIILESVGGWLPGMGTVGIVARNWRNIFHNAHGLLGCIHCEPHPALNLEPGGTAVFQQRIYLHDGDHHSMLEAYENESYDFGCSKAPE